MSLEWVEIGELQAKKNGSIDPSKFLDETFELHSIPSHDKGNAEILTGREIGSSKQIVQENDVMISKIVPHIRRAMVVPKKGNFRQIASSEWIVFRSERIYPNYLKHLLISDFFNAQFMATVSGVGGSLLRARPTFVSKIKIPLPPLTEQKRIAQILDKADELRQKRQQSIDKLNELLQACFLKIFENEKCSMSQIKDLLENGKSIRTGPFGSQLLHSEFVDEGIAVLGIDNAVKNTFKWAKPRFITPEKYEQLKRYTVKPKDVIITIMGTCGKCAVVPDKIPLSINTKHLCCITLDFDKCNPEFLHSYFLLHPTSINFLKSRAKGAIMAGLNMSIIKDLPVELPSIEIQNEFAELKTKIGLQKSKLINQLQEQDNLFQSLQQRAFNGEL
jgi:type I restriction enzyme S subunit